jgi:hypothetical protein
VVRLRPKALALLAALAAHPGEVVSRETLLATVWHDVVVGEASVGVVVAELRKALGDEPKDCEYIETIPRRGYRLIAPVANGEPRHGDSGRAASRFWLVGHGLEFALAEGSSIIGRAPDADIRIPSPKVSRHHARIVVDGDSATIEDLGSKNGTFIGDTRVGAPTPLRHDDELRLGHLAAALRLVALDRESTITELSRAARSKPARRRSKVDD